MRARCRWAHLGAEPADAGKAELIIGDALRDLVAEGQRVLVGFDFPYGYPAGLAAALELAGPPWRAMWQYLVAGVRDDGETNASNRFEVAARINASLQHQVFWGRPFSQPFDELSARRDCVVYRLEAEQARLAEWREVEAILRGRGHRPHSAWQLFGNGSVGSQTLTGIPVVCRLRNDRGVAAASAVWPFEVTLFGLGGKPMIVGGHFSLSSQFCRNRDGTRRRQAGQFPGARSRVGSTPAAFAQDG